MEATPAIANAVAWFGAHTVTHHLDVVDRVAASIINTLTAEGSTVHFYNANGYEFMTLTSDDVSKRFKSLFDERLVGTRHAGDGRLYAILKDGDRTREEPVDLFPFADVQVGSNCEFGRRITSVAVEYGPADVTVSLVAPFALQRKERNSMIGTKYTPGLLAELAKTPHLRSMEIPVNPDEQWVSSFTRCYTDDRECKTTLFDVGDAELASITVDGGADDSRFGFMLNRDVEKVAVSAHPKGLSVSFVIDQWPEDGLDKRIVVLSSSASVELRSEVGAVSVIEETHTSVDTITSFFEDETSGDPWLVIIEPD